MNNPIIAWFSCGATSAVACKMALQMYENVRIVYIKTGSEHPDNDRFICDCEKWFGQPITVLRSNKYKSVADVLIRRHYINGVNGAACTYLLKKQVRYEFENQLGEWNGQVWGFDFCVREVNRAIRFKQQNPYTKPLFPLIERQITKQDALGILIKAGIEIPVMYRLGYHNNNCIGCVKGGIAYWNKIRKDYPETFIEMARIERELGHSCLHDKEGAIFLDALDPNRGDEIKAIEPDCSLFCQVEFEELKDPQTDKVMNGEKNINETK